MARIQPDEIVDELKVQFRRALAAALEDVAPETEIDEYELYRAFRRAIRRKCSTWETVPDRFVQKD